MTTFTRPTLSTTSPYGIIRDDSFRAVIYIPPMEVYVSTCAGEVLKILEKRPNQEPDTARVYISPDKRDARIIDKSLAYVISNNTYNIPIEIIYLEAGLVFEATPLLL